MKRSRAKIKKYKRINGVLHESLNSPYDGRVIGWIAVE
jgi:hypothetical protein